MTDIRTHRVATAAYQRVDARRGDANRRQYGALAHKLPGLILQNGLAQATGFLIAKGKPEHLALLDDLNQVLRASGAVTSDDGETLHQLIIATDLHQNLRLTRRALEASAWLKRYVQGVLKLSATGDPSDAATDPRHEDSPA